MCRSHSSLPLCCRSGLLGACSLCRQLASEHQITMTGSTSSRRLSSISPSVYEQAHPGPKDQCAGPWIERRDSGRRERHGRAWHVLAASRTRRSRTTCCTIEIARDALVIIVHPSNTVTNLTPAQVRAMFTGQDPELERGRRTRCTDHVGDARSRIRHLWRL